jgi:geranylgeranyl pyrophosphate synthase
MRLVTEQLKRAYATDSKTSESFTFEKHLAGIDACLQKRLSSHSRHPRELSERLINSGGKRIRPLLLVATYESLREMRGGIDKFKLDDLYQLGAVAELVHMASLFHDDVIDQSEERRNIPAAHVLQGNKIAILVGDYVYAEAFARLMEKSLLYPSQRLAATIQQLVEGEILQHEIVISRNFDMNQFIQIAELKTASLFSWCSEIGAWATGSDLLEEAASLGHHLGLAFQVIDDTIDTLATGELSQEFIKEFLASAPSYPLLLLFEKDEESYRAWRDLPLAQESHKRMIIAELLKKCRSPEVLKRCQQRIEESLDLASEHVKALGSSDILNGLVDQLKFRADQALSGEKVSS